MRSKVRTHPEPLLSVGFLSVWGLIGSAADVPAADVPAVSGEAGDHVTLLRLLPVSHQTCGSFSLLDL